MTLDPPFAMSGSANSTDSREVTPHDGDESFSIFFDFESQVPSGFARAPPGQLNSETPEPAPRSGIRVSLACIPCRSRHVKCDAEMPACLRCLQDDKACFYAKSRRGMRDKNAPKKAAPLREGAVRSTAQSPNVSHRGASMRPSIARSTTEPYRTPASDVSVSPRSSSSRIGGSPNPKRLLDLYYNFFHKPHPYVLPRYYLLARKESDPDSLRSLYLVMLWIGSLYAPDVSSAELRECALNHVDMMRLPPNAFTVQTLLIASIAVVFQNELDFGRALLDRAIYLALEIGMNFQAFANMERDPVLAESWRRTYWGLYAIDANVAGIQQASNFILFSIDSDVELPCEECDYDGVIPRPKKLAEYDAREFDEETHVFSSFTYYIDVCRIVGTVLPFKSLPFKDLESAVANADAMLVNWKLHLPREKQGMIDKHEEVDEMLFQAHSMVQSLLVFIHRPLSRLYHCPLEEGHIPAPIRLNPHQGNSVHEHSLWLHTRKTIEAAEACADLSALPFSILHHSPFSIFSLSMSTLAHLSACAHVVTGEDWFRTRDRVRLGMGALKVFGEVWVLSRKVESEAKAVARGVFALPKTGSLSGIGSGITMGANPLGFGVRKQMDVRNQQQMMALSPDWEDFHNVEVDYSTWYDPTDLHASGPVHT